MIENLSLEGAEAFYMDWWESGSKKKKYISAGDEERWQGYGTGEKWKEQSKRRKSLTIHES